MLKRNIAFFQDNTQNANQETQESSLDKVKKHLDAQIEYNRFLMERLLRGKSEDIFEIVASMFLDLSEVPRSIKLPPSNILEELKKEFITHIVADLKEYQRLKDCANKGTNLDYLYLSIHFTCKNWLLGVQNTQPKKLELLLSHLYSGNDLKKKVKEILYRIHTKSLKSPLMAEIFNLSEILSILEPEVSHDCLRFKDDIQIIQDKDMTVISITEEAMSGKSKKIIQFLDKNPSNLEFLSLVEKWIEANNKLKTAEVSSNLNDSYLVTFERMKIKYQVEDEINRFLQEAAARQKDSKIAETLEAPKDVGENQSEIGLSSQPSKSRKKVRERGNHPVKMGKQEAILQSEKTSVERLEEIEKPLKSSYSMKEAVIEPPKDQLEQDMLPQLPSSSHVETIHFNSTTVQEADISITSLKHEEDEEKLNENVETYTYVQDYTLFAKKNDARQQQQKDDKKPKRNVLNLNKEQQETYLKVFDLMPYESINLRALVNLTQALGGTLKTTGANRCRIELKNIYAHLLVPEEALAKACDKATVTMHGGGHRSKSSQNNDREKAPDYLISQFKAAFIRAGYTPINLGLNSDITSNESPTLEN
ncbi:hypothetical protein [Legionella brunensis]|uniref:hypothetical protein n=1 Tax=Legionella brunensis TaxID=29422 RepID=UPI001040FCB1|nr:hypothetical protein [Legionella brunensis]